MWTGSRTAQGFGQVRVEGRLHTATQVAWQLIHGPIPEGGKVVGCPAEPACVRVDHLSFTLWVPSIHRRWSGQYSERRPIGARS